MMDQIAPSPPFRAAARLETLDVSEIVRIGARAVALKKSGHPVIVLGAGEPDFDTPDNVCEAAIAAIRAGDTKYTALDGTPELKEAIVHKMKRENGLDYTLAEVSVGTGAKQVIYNAMMATLDPGDEVIIPTPYWTSYSAIVEIAGGTPVLVPCDDVAGFKLSPAQLAAAVTPRTRWLMLNSPSNPTGAAYSERDFSGLAAVLMTKPHVWLMTDEIYEHIVYDGFHSVSPLLVEPALKNRTLIVNGVSKAYAMTGWRIGYGVGPASLIRAMAVVQSQATSNPASISQAAAVEALNGPQQAVALRREEFRERRDLVVDRLRGIAGVTCRKPEGAFYTFANCSGLLGRRTPEGSAITSDREFCSWLLEAVHVATVPGVAFGLSPYFRISYATSKAELVEALDRIAVACATLQPF